MSKQINLSELLFERNIDWNHWWSTFNSLSPRGMLDFAKETLNEIGHGGSRYVFNIWPGKVLKIDVHGQQNKEEYRAAVANPGFVPTVYNHHKNFYWIVSELVKPLAGGTSIDDNEDWEEAILKNQEQKQKGYALWLKASGGITWEEFMWWLFNYLPKQQGYDPEDHDLTPEKFSMLMKKFNNSAFIKRTKLFLSKFSDSDMGDLGQWGINSSGKLVYLDPGLSDF